MSKKLMQKQQVKSGWKNVIYTGVSGVWDQILRPEKVEDLHGVSDKASGFTHDRSVRVLTPGVSGLTGVSGL
jgi:hypothetical protein